MFRLRRAPAPITSSFLIPATYLWGKLLHDWFGNGVRLMVPREEGITSLAKLKLLAMGTHIG